MRTYDAAHMITPRLAQWHDASDAANKRAARIRARARNFFCGFALALIVHLSPLPARAAPVTIGGPFTLVAPDGATVTERTYSGKWLLVYFGYTFCPNTCPTALLDMATALQKLGPDADKIQVLFITVDPRRDTRAVMEKYTQSFDPRIVGLTGTAEQIAAVAKAYGAYYAPHRTGAGPDDYVMDHSTFIYLMDPHDKFMRGFAADASADDIADGVRKVMARSSQGMSDNGIAKPTIR